MTAKEYLSQVRALREDIERISQEISAREAAIRSAGAVRYDEVRVQTSPMNRQEEMIVRNFEEKERLLKLQEAYSAKYLEIISRLDQMEGQYRRILEFYYLDGRGIRWISERMHYTPESVYTLLWKARKMFEEKFLK